MCCFMRPARYVFDYEVVVIVVSNSREELNLLKKKSKEYQRQTSSRGGVVACPIAHVQHPVLPGGY